MIKRDDDPCPDGAEIEGDNGGTGLMSEFGGRRGGRVVG